MCVLKLRKEKINLYFRRFSYIQCQLLILLLLNLTCQDLESMLSAASAVFEVYAVLGVFPNEGIDNRTCILEEM